MVAFRQLLIAIRGTLGEWLRLRWTDLQFAEAQTTLFVLVVLLALSLLVLLARSLWSGKAGRTHLALPAVLRVMRRSPLSASRHVPFVLFLVGVPFFAVALADPFTTFRREEVSYPGRRIAIMVDSSTSMAMKFESTGLHANGVPAFYTAVAAAEYFIKLRMNGPYHDLMALLQFGNFAYVVTPFTTDYQNILLSTKLISNPQEWGRFTDWGTTIVQGIDQGLKLFKLFDFRDASGNLMVIFTDGRDSQTNIKGSKLVDLMAEARKNKIPIYMIRTAFKLKFGEVPQDQLWKDAIEPTGGHFYPAADEAAILAAVKEIDQLAPGRIQLREYTSQRPRFEGYALIAIGFWVSAGLLKLIFPYFRTFP